MNKLIRQTINFLLITLVINSGFWTFNKDAVADVWFDEQPNHAVVNEQYSVNPEAYQSVSHTIPCNHWCHFIGHFMALHNRIEHITPELALEFSALQFISIQSAFLDSHFRPPQ